MSLLRKALLAVLAFTTCLSRSPAPLPFGGGLGALPLPSASLRDRFAGGQAAYSCPRGKPRVHRRPAPICPQAASRGPLAGRLSQAPCPPPVGSGARASPPLSFSADWSVPALSFVRKLSGSPTRFATWTAWGAPQTRAACHRFFVRKLTTNRRHLPRLPGSPDD